MTKARIVSAPSSKTISRVTSAVKSQSGSTISPAFSLNLMRQIRPPSILMGQDRRYSVFLSVLLESSLDLHLHSLWRCGIASVVKVAHPDGPICS